LKDACSVNSLPFTNWLADPNNYLTAQLPCAPRDMLPCNNFVNWSQNDVATWSVQAFCRTLCWTPDHKSASLL